MSTEQAKVIVNNSLRDVKARIKRIQTTGNQRREFSPEQVKRIRLEGYQRTAKTLEQIIGLLD